MISAGGGRVGRPLLEEAIERLNGTPMRAIAGPLMPQEDFDALKRRVPGNVELIRSVPDLSQELRHAAASISQCGYNTALDLVRTRVPALVVPYATPGGGRADPPRAPARSARPRARRRARRRAAARLRARTRHASTSTAPPPPATCCTS